MKDRRMQNRIETKMAARPEPLPGDRIFATSFYMPPQGQAAPAGLLSLCHHGLPAMEAGANKNHRDCRHSDSFAIKYPVEVVRMTPAK